MRASEQRRKLFACRIQAAPSRGGRRLAGGPGAGGLHVPAVDLLKRARPTSHQEPLRLGGRQRVAFEHRTVYCWHWGAPILSNS